MKAIEVPEDVIAKLLVVLEDSDTLLHRINRQGDVAHLYSEVNVQRERLRSVKHELEERAKEKTATLES